MHMLTTILLNHRILRGCVVNNPAPFPCLHPPGTDIDTNIAQAQQNSIIWWFAMVQNWAPWDYKRQNPEYDNFGNFNFGATGCALGIPLNILQRGAGSFKNLPKFGHWWWRYPYGNDLPPEI